MRKLSGILILFLASVGLGESRSEIMEKLDRTDFKHNKNGVESTRALEEKATDIYAGSKKTGFYEFDSDVQRSNVIAKTIVSSLTGPKRRDNVLVLHLSCTIPDSMVAFNLRNKDIVWNLRNKKLTGSSQTDGEGFLRIRFSSSGSVKRESISLNIKNTIANVDLSTGPYELFFPEEICKSK